MTKGKAERGKREMTKGKAERGKKEREESGTQADVLRVVACKRL